MSFEYSKEFAQDKDKQDELSSFREQFLFPQHDGKEVVYLTGNSLGLQPKTTREHINQELDDWAKFGVEGHFDAKVPWFSYHEILTEQSAKIVGALPSEVVVMNQLTSNLHFLMVSFYRPSKERYKIICEAGAFPSDQYALESQVKFHGFNPDDAIIEVAPKAGGHIISNEAVIEAIHACGDQLAMVMIGAVNYYSGQVFDMENITKAGHAVGATVGFDLAHAAGNIQLNLHDWQVDFAAWCSYKYLNSGPGSVAGAFVHQKHESNTDLPRFAGWWGHDKATRFLMKKGFQPIKGAEGWQLSNAPVFAMAAHKASLDIFEKAGMERLIKKSRELTDYAEFIVEEVNKNIQKTTINLEIITPKDHAARACQLSIIAHGLGKDLFNKITAEGVIADWREPNVIRIAPVPLYNSFEDVFRFGKILEAAINN